MIDFQGSQFEKKIILWEVRWYVAYPLSSRQLEEMMQERGVSVDHATLNRWVIHPHHIQQGPGGRPEVQVPPAAHSDLAILDADR